MWDMPGNAYLSRDDQHRLETITDPSEGPIR
jgi:hypothetical protein